MCVCIAYSYLGITISWDTTKLDTITGILVVYCI